MRTHIKDPDEILIYGFDWSDWLESGDTLSTSSWDVQAGSGLTSASPSISGSNTLVKISGGTVIASDGSPYQITNTVTTSAGLVGVRSLFLWVQER